MKKKIKKHNICKYATAGVLTAALVSGGLAIHDKNIDHTKEICPISVIEHALTGNYNHQVKEIADEYNEQNMPLAKVYYDSEYHPVIYRYEYASVHKHTDDNGNVHYFLPEGYTLTKIGDVYVGVKKHFQAIHLVGNPEGHNIPDNYEIRDVNNSPEWVKVSHYSYPAIVTSTYDFDNQKYNQEEVLFQLGKAR